MESLDTSVGDLGVIQDIKNGVCGLIPTSPLRMWDLVACLCFTRLSVSYGFLVRLKAELPILPRGIGK